MSDLTGDDLTTGEEVKWYSAGTSAGDEEITADSTDVSNTYLSLAASAEYGTVVVFDQTDNAIVNSVTECSAGTTPATDGEAVATIAFTVELAHVYLVKYCAITAALVHIASCKDVSWTGAADERTVALHGQANKVKKYGAVDNTGTLDSVIYNQTLIALAIGDQMNASPAAAKTKHTTAFNGMKKIGGLVGKKYSAAGVCLKKYYLAGVQFGNIADTFATEDFYSRSMSFSCDYRTEVDLS